MQPTSFTYRVAGDADLVLAMLRHAANWDPTRPAFTPEQVAANAQLSHYAEGWPQPGDLGVVVEDAHGMGRKPNPRSGSTSGSASRRSATTATP